VGLWFHISIKILKTSPYDDRENYSIVDKVVFIRPALLPREPVFPDGKEREEAYPCSYQGSC
jgi:hypothetical protein